MPCKHDFRPENSHGQSANQLMQQEAGPERFTFFWSGPFSQWHKSTFNVAGRTFTHAEQYMMYSKAILFGDAATAAKILACRDPREQKALGRTVRGFSDETWKLFRLGIVFTASYAKFNQNATLRAEILRTAGTTLVEASPTDRIWGIGLAEEDPRAQARDTWLGANLLGETLTRVRDVIAAERQPWSSEIGPTDSLS